MPNHVADILTSPHSTEHLAALATFSPIEMVSYRRRGNCWLRERAVLVLVNRGMTVTDLPPEQT